MTPDGIKEKFENYRKWFNAFLVQEFINLPYESQRRLMALVNKFLKDCHEINEDAKGIKERTIRSVIKAIEGDTVIVEINGEKVKLGQMKNKKQGMSINVTLFSIDGETWYSSKKELITGRS